MVKATITIPAILILFILVSVSHVSGISFENPHFVPSEPVVEEEVTFFITVRLEPGEEIDHVSLSLDNKTTIMERKEENENGNNSEATEGILYQTVLRPANEGDLTLIFTAYTSDNLSHTLTENITVGNTEDGDGNDPEGDTILGFPKWYCSVSVLFLTAVVIFLTWAYFKGRSLQKRTTAKTGAARIQCSSCGRPIGQDDTVCPYCKADLEEDEYICGKCGKPVTADDEVCRECGTSLMAYEPDKSHKNDNKTDSDLKKLHGKLDMKGKIECSNCKTVYLRSEERCPECGERY